MRRDFQQSLFAAVHYPYPCVDSFIIFCIALSSLTISLIQEIASLLQKVKEHCLRPHCYLVLTKQ